MLLGYALNLCRQVGHVLHKRVPLCWPRRSIRSGSWGYLSCCSCPRGRRLMLVLVHVFHVDSRAGSFPLPKALPFFSGVPRSYDGAEVQFFVPCNRWVHGSRWPPGTYGLFPLGITLPRRERILPTKLNFAGGVLETQIRSPLPPLEVTRPRAYSIRRCTRDYSLSLTDVYFHIQRGIDASLVPVQRPGFRSPKPG